MANERIKSWIIKYPPDTVFLMGLCVLSGIMQLFFPNDVLSTMPVWVSIGWSVLLGMGSLTALVGIFWTNLPIGFLIEGAGRSMLWPASGAYAIVLAYEGVWVSSFLVLTFGVACFVRSLYIRMVYNEWRQVMESQK